MAVYSVPGKRSTKGTKETSSPLYVIVPTTGVVPLYSVKVDPFKVSGSMSILNLAVTIFFKITPVSRFTGLVDITVGAVVAIVVNFQT